MYYATTVIEDFSPKYWSIVIEFEKPLEEKEFTTPCKLHFLMNNAPSQILDELSALVVYCNVLELVDNLGFLISFFFDKFIC